MAEIELRQVEKKFGELHAVKPMDLTVEHGEFVVLLGPSGCGKTTTLRMISGLETVTGGTIWLNGRNVTWRHPSERDIAFVFQFYALYPHLTVRQNIAFPLESQGESRDTIDKRVKEVVDMLRIEYLLNQRPGNLSGGDQQRVALARALVRRPAAFLMDEPLGSLDAEFREAMRAEIKRLHIEQHATTVYVTHDQIEAMAMGDRIVVMSNAVVQQMGTPAEVYHKPANLFVARFIGSPGMNLMTGRYADDVVSLPGDRPGPDARTGRENQFKVPAEWRSALDQALGREGEVVVGFRPEAGMIVGAPPVGALAGEVYATDMHGAYAMLHVNLNGTDIVHIRSDRRVSFPIGAPVRFDINPEMVRFFDPTTSMAITRRSAL
jgi:multiple sugar transport system ATP-binding protein